jgi:hypothetical protein
MRRRWLAVACALACCALGRGAVAAGRRRAPDAGGLRPRIGLLKVDALGMAADLRARFLGVLIEKLRGAGYDVLEEELVQQKLLAAGAPPGCVTGRCLTDVGRALGARRVVVGGLAAAGSNYDVTLTLLDTEARREVAQSVDRCEVCTLDEGLSTMARAASQIASQPLPGGGGEDTAATPRQLAQLPPPADHGARAPAPWWEAGAARWTVAGLAAVALGTGITLLALDGGCASDARPGHECRDRYNNSGAGWVLLGTGVLVGAGAVALFWHASRNGETQVAVGWSGRF